MPDQTPLEEVHSGISAIGEIVKIAASTPEAKQAASNFGKTAITLTSAINNALLPLAAVNFAFDKARSYFSNRFSSEIQEATKAIPAENLIEPAASIAGPALQGLAFAHEEPSLKDMYLNLLATAMNSQVSEDAHPAFVEIIRQLNGREARLLQGILQRESALPIAEIRANTQDGSGYVVLATHVMNMVRGGAPVEDKRLAAMIDNWVRLGLTSVTYESYLVGDKNYNWVETRPEFKKFAENPDAEGRKISFQKGCIERTNLGRLFGTAVGCIKDV